MRGLVAPALRALLAAHPDLRVTLTEREPWDTVDLVASGQVDLGVVHSWGDVPLPIPDHLASTAIAHDVADVIVRRDHPLAGRAGGHAARPGRRGLDRHPRGDDLPAVAAADVRRHRAVPDRARVDGVRHPPRPGARGARHRAGPAARSGELPEDVVAVPAHDPVPTREIIVLHRRSMADSPAVGALVAALGG